MKYNGITLKEFTSDKPVVFDPPKQMLCWNNEGDIPENLQVFAYLPATGYGPAKCWNCNMAHCAEIPEISKEPKPRRATNLELAKWLATGNGQATEKNSFSAWTEHVYNKNMGDCACSRRVEIRKWGDTEWHEPTADYMGLEG